MSLMSLQQPPGWLLHVRCWAHRCWAHTLQQWIFELSNMVPVRVSGDTANRQLRDDSTNDA